MIGPYLTCQHPSQNSPQPPKPEHRGALPHTPRSPRGRGAGDGLRPKPPHPTTGTSAAPVQHQGFGFAPVLTRSHSLRSLALRLPGWPLTLPLCFPDRRLFGFGMEKGSRGKPEAARGAQGRSPEHRTGEDLSAATLDAFGMTHAPVMGVGGFKAVGRPPAPLTTEGDSFPRRGRRGRINSRKAAHSSPTAMLLKGWGSRYGGG